MSRLTSAALTAAILIAGSPRPSAAPAAPHRRMSLQNRLLFNRAAVTGLQKLEVLMLASHSVERLTPRVIAAGGAVKKTERGIGYMRVEVPTGRLFELIDSSEVEAYQISSLSRGAWYRDTPPAMNATMFRDYEVTPIAPTEPEVEHPELPLLSPAEAHSPAFTADDAGVGEWIKAHPTFDGRGTTVAIIEDGRPAFNNPEFRGAKALDGRETTKVVGIINPIDLAKPDESRVSLSESIDAAKAWARVGQRTYVFPKPGRYWFGMLEVPAGGNVVHRFGIAEDPASREVWIDSNGDASFQDEKPLSDVNERFEPGVLKLAHPRKVDVSFVMGRSADPRVIYIYVGKGSHLTMTASVAAGSRSEDSLASGVAPNARLVFVRASTAETGLASIFEGFLAAAQHPSVDVISASIGLTLVPDTAPEFGSTFFRRLIAAYQKPVVIGAANTSQVIGNIHSGGSALSVGGIVSPQNYAALYGGRALDRTIVSPISAAGPTFDGVLKPDVVAPMHRIAADLPWKLTMDVAPQNAPTRRLPPGYQISCCTSSTAPYTAGVIALLISAARQSGLNPDADAVMHALRSSAELIPGYQAHQQGNGAIDINGAWNVLTHPTTRPRIVATAAIVHPLAQYAGRGPEGSGILEVEGWTAGMTAVRHITLRRESGSTGASTFRLDWSAGDGTFTAPESVTLPLNAPVSIPITIAVKTPGAHSALLNVRDPSTNEVIFRTQATIVAAERFDPSTQMLELRGRVGLMRQSVQYFHVPEGTRAISFELEVTHGVIQPTIVPAHGLFPSYYMNVHPSNMIAAGAGSYHMMMLPDPRPGTWTFTADNDSMWSPMPLTTVKASGDDAEYTLRLRLSRGLLRSSSPLSGRQIGVEIENVASAIDEPVIEASAGYQTSHRADFLPSGLPNRFEITVPKDAASLSLDLRTSDATASAELYLFDCSTGECFSYNIGFPAARAHTLTVRKPNAGRWVAAVNAAPFPTASGGFVLDEVISVGLPSRQTSTTARAHGATWQATLDPPPSAPDLPGRTPVIVIELQDDALERREIEKCWFMRPDLMRLRDRPVALARLVQRR